MTMNLCAIALLIAYVFANIHVNDGSDSAPAMPMPSLPNIPSKLPSSVDFYRGQTAADGTTYPCVRIPSICKYTCICIYAYILRRQHGGGGNMNKLVDISQIITIIIIFTIIFFLSLFSSECRGGVIGFF